MSINTCCPEPEIRVWGSSKTKQTEFNIKATLCFVNIWTEMRHSRVFKAQKRFISLNNFLKIHVREHLFAKTIHSSDRCGISRCWLDNMDSAQVCLGLVLKRWGLTRMCSFISSVPQMFQGLGVCATGMLAAGMSTCELYVHFTIRCLLCHLRDCGYIQTPLYKHFRDFFSSIHLNKSVVFIFFFSEHAATVDSVWVCCQCTSTNIIQC